MRLVWAIALCIFLGAGAPLSAATVLFDFETDEEVTLWHDERKTTLGADKRLERSQAFAASGQFSMRFWTGKWRPEEHGGARKWPAFEGKPPITDWSRYDRLVMELVNVTDTPHRLMLFITDSEKPTRHGLSHREMLPPHTRIQAVIPVRKGFADRKVDASDIQVMHFFTEDPPEEMVIHIDRLLLLEPGEEIPPLPASYLKELATLQAPNVEKARADLGEAAGRLEEAARGKPRLAEWATKEIAGLRKELSRVEAALAQGDEAVLEAPKALARLREETARLESLLALRVRFERIRPAVQVGPAEEVVVGFASSMEKVLPRAGAVSPQIRERVQVALARNEKESLQVVVLPCERDLKRVQVRARDLFAGPGRRFSARNIQAVPVGYVETKATPPYGSPHIGWWPDPILDFMKEADVAKGDAQAFWIRVRAPKSQVPDLYHGKLDVLVEGRPRFAFDFAVRVYGFTMPDASPLPLAITFAPHDHPTDQTKEVQAKWREMEEYPVNAWRRHRSRWADFLADYYITYDSLYEYSGWEPNFEDLARLHRQGRLGRFNLGYFPVYTEDGWPDVIKRIRARYEKAKALGLLEYAYIYGCDEHPKEKFPGVERAAAELKKEFPDVMVMTTTYDHSFGLESEIQSVDAWCPLTSRFDPERAAAARARGKEVWWYICCGPHHPHANMFIEYPAIEGRLLMGALTAKYRPDGFLYYQISIWNSRKPITGGPFTDWDPRSWTTYHGDGSWTCVGPGGTPLATIRLENFRDGLEDYAYVRILEATIAKVEASPQLHERQAKWLETAKALLEVPAEVAESMTRYTDDPAAVYRWRDRIARAIETAGTSPAAPWDRPAPGRANPE
ncbi:MAG: DUF4091 domain-containing protein [Armatimonadetes bacterium]|nr:DUF4091 domain-containing protein [Armatimonadota bacterium]